MDTLYVDSAKWTSTPVGPVDTMLLRAGLSIVPVVPWEGAPAARGPPINHHIFYRSVLTFERAVYAGLNVTTTTKNRSSTFWEKKSTPRERKSWVYAYEKRAPA